MNLVTGYILIVIILDRNWTKKSEIMQFKWTRY